jgi:hypothetical protein
VQRVGLLSRSIMLQGSDLAVSPGCITSACDTSTALPPVWQEDNVAAEHCKHSRLQWPGVPGRCGAGSRFIIAFRDAGIA